MRTFAIKNDRHKKRPPQAWLLYDTEKDEYSIRISRYADIEDLPFMLSCAAEKGIYELGNREAGRFVRSRVIPPERQNLGSILKANGLEYYDMFDFLLLNMGRCCMDDYYIEETESIAEKGSYGNLIAEERIKLGFTQAELAEKSGLKQSNISRIENGAVQPSMETMEAIARGLGKKLQISFV